MNSRQSKVIGYKAIIEEIEAEEKLTWMLRDWYSNISKAKVLVEDIPSSNVVFASLLEQVESDVKFIHDAYTGESLPPLLIVDWFGDKQQAIEKQKRVYRGSILSRDEFSKLSTEKIICRFNNKLPIIFYALDSLGHKDLRLVYSPKYRRYQPLFGFFEKQLHVISRVVFSLADSLSRKTFLSIMKCIETGSVDYVPFPTFTHYFHPLVKAVTGDIICDAGLLNEAKVLEFAEAVGSLGHVFGFEACKSVAEVIDAKISGMRKYPNVTVVPMGLWSDRNTFYINPKAGGTAALSPTQAVGFEKCEAIPLDSFFTEEKKSPNFIKMDIEGAEVDALYGARSIICAHTPKLSISIYHRIKHYFEIPLMVKRMHPNYQLYIHHHNFVDRTETVLYAVSP